MSQVVFAPPAGLDWNIKKTPRYSTIKADTTSKRGQLRIALQSYPIWEYELQWNYLKGAEQVGGSALQYMMGFYMARQGSFDSFLYSDVNDNAVAAQNFGTGDGTTRVFQLTRSIGTGTDIVQNLNAAPSIFVNGVLKTVTTDYTISSTGIVTFVAAPGNTLPLTWTGSYYYRVHFMDDSLDFSEFVFQLWELKQVKLESLIL